jgi:alpha-glucosidase
LATRWAGGDLVKARCALLILLTLRGTPFLYQGDEIGLTDGPIEQSDLHDAVGIRFWPYYKGRDPERTPMPWANQPNGGFTEPGVRPWLPMADPADCNVADQLGDPDSVFAFTRRVIAQRRANDDLAVGTYRSLPSPKDTWLYVRGDKTTVVLNLSDRPAIVNGLRGTVTVATDRTLEGAASAGEMTLAPWTGAVLEA